MREGGLWVLIIAGNISTPSNTRGSVFMKCILCDDDASLGGLSCATLCNGTRKSTPATITIDQSAGRRVGQELSRCHTDNHSAADLSDESARMLTVSKFRRYAAPAPTLLSVSSHAQSRGRA